MIREWSFIIKGRGAGKLGGEVFYLGKKWKFKFELFNGLQEGGGGVELISKRGSKFFNPPPGNKRPLPNYQVSLKI